MECRVRSGWVKKSQSADLNQSSRFCAVLLSQRHCCHAYVADQTLLHTWRQLSWHFTCAVHLWTKLPTFSVPLEMSFFTGNVNLHLCAALARIRGTHRVWQDIFYAAKIVTSDDVFDDGGALQVISSQQLPTVFLVWGIWVWWTTRPRLRISTAVLTTSTSTTGQWRVHAYHQYTDYRSVVCARLPPVHRLRYSCCFEC